MRNAIHPRHWQRKNLPTDCKSLFILIRTVRFRKVPFPRIQEYLQL